MYFGIMYVSILAIVERMNLRLVAEILMLIIMITKMELLLTVMKTLVSVILKFM